MHLKILYVTLTRAAQVERRRAVFIVQGHHVDVDVASGHRHLVLRRLLLLLQLLLTLLALLVGAALDALLALLAG